MKAIRIVEEDGTVRWCTDERRVDPELKYMFEKRVDVEQARKDGRSIIYYRNILPSQKKIK
jgi:hypothetical protein